MSRTGRSGLDAVLALPAGEVKLVLADRVSEVLSDLKAYAAESNRDGRMVAKKLDRLPSTKGLIAGFLHDLADIALALWPHWYGESQPLPAVEKGSLGLPLSLSSLLPFSTSRLEPEWLLPAWLKLSVPLCLAGKPPLPRGFSPSIQVVQLVSAISTREMLIAICVEDEQPELGRLLGLARAAEWLAAKTAARVLVVIPAPLASSTELDSINFHAIFWPKGTDEEETTGEETNLSVWPVIGRPHPFSPGEQLLAAHLTRDAQLGGLFSFNVRANPLRHRAASGPSLAGG